MKNESTAEPVGRALAIRTGLRRCIGSRVCQVIGVTLTFVLVGVLHRHNDGLFLSDAARHAINGFFWWDLLMAFPRDPFDFTVRYYARYPVISPATYPPLFYVLEGMAFAALGPSPHVAKFIVLVFATIAGLYTTAWARRWIGPVAGWSGAFLAFLPGITIWSNAVMLNMPATALGVASLYHLRRWFETGRTTQFVATALLVIGVLLLYYPGGVVLCICAAWAVRRVRHLRFDRRSLWLAAAALGAFLPLLLAAVLAPVQTARHLPTIELLTSLRTWTYYWTALPAVVGVPALALGLLGCAAGLARTRWRTESGYVALWIVVAITTLSVLPAKDPRYILIVAPAFLIGAAIGLACASRHLPSLSPEWQAAALIGGLAVGSWSAAHVPVPHLSGFRELAVHLLERAPEDAVLYDGTHAWQFGFYVRALDPQFERRLVRGDKLLYQYGHTTTFRVTEELNVTSTDDVVDLLRTQCGCRWVAIEEGVRAVRVRGGRLLREAVARREFEFVRSFPITGGSPRRVDLYRIAIPVDPVTAVNVRFRASIDRTYRGVIPITRASGSGTRP